MKCKRGPGEFCAKEKEVFNHIGRGQESWFKGRRESWDTVRGFERPANRWLLGLVLGKGRQVLGQGDGRAVLV